MPEDPDADAELRRLVAERERVGRAADAAIAAQIGRMRAAGTTWAHVGRVLGISRQAARQHWGGGRT